LAGFRIAYITTEWGKAHVKYGFATACLGVYSNLAVNFG